MYTGTSLPIPPAEKFFEIIATKVMQIISEYEEQFPPEVGGIHRRGQEDDNTLGVPSRGKSSVFDGFFRYTF